MQEFKAGQRIKVEYTGIIPESGKGTDARLLFEGVYLQVRPLEDIKVTLADPKDWPPQMGDIWEANGREYYVQSSLSRKVVVRPDDTMHAQPSLESFKALNPVLVRRRGR